MVYLFPHAMRAEGANRGGSKVVFPGKKILKNLDGLEHGECISEHTMVLYEL